jgi:cysteine desulfuration protein SufE
MTLSEREAEIIEEFSFFEDWMDKYGLLIEQSKHLEPMDSALKTDEYRVNGCVSQVWLHAQLQGNVVHFTADSDAQITKGIVALLVRALNNLPPAVIQQAELRFIDEIGLQQHLSPNRANGLSAMVKQMKLYAIALGN